MCRFRNNRATTSRSKKSGPKCADATTTIGEFDSSTASISRDACTGKSLDVRLARLGNLV